VPGERQAYLAEVLAPHMRTLLARCLAHDPDPPARAHADSTLTRRELELLQWLVAGRTTADIARSTFRSTHTVSNQVRAILRKLRASNRTEAIAVALGLGLVAPVERQGVTRVMAAQVPLAYQVSRRRRHSRHQRATRVFRLDNESSAGGDR
jgi:DNA-binding CsgD family transcriptional regulator